MMLGTKCTSDIDCYTGVRTEACCDGGFRREAQQIGLSSGEWIWVTLAPENVLRMYDYARPLRDK